jgi:hypothetical protein
MPQTTDIADDASHLPSDCARCERCKALSTDLYGGVCCSCRRDLLERLMGPKIDWLLRLLRNSVELREILRLLEAWGNDYGGSKGDAGTPTRTSPQTKEQYGQPNDPRQQIVSELKKWRGMWSPLIAWQNQYLKVANDVDRKVEFFCLIQAAIASRRLFRRYLRSRFSMAHARRRRFLRDGPQLQTEHECTDLESALDLFDFYDAILHVGLYAILPFWMDGQLHMAIPVAVAEMRGVLMGGLPLTVGLGLNHAVTAGDSVKQERCILMLSGWMATQISLRRNLRLRKALSEDGTSPDVALLEQLPAEVYAMWRARASDADLSRLRDEVCWSLERDRSQPKPVPSKGGVGQPPINVPLDQQLAAQDEYLAWLKGAGLTALEEAVTSLQLHEYTDHEIAKKLGRTLWSVKTAWRRAKEKLSDTAPH